MNLVNTLVLKQKEEKIMSNETYPRFDTKLFTDIYDDAGTFVYYYKHCGIPTTISDSNCNTLYYLLYARYGNNPIANMDEEQFKYKVCALIFQYGPTWEKRLAIQQSLRGLSDSDLLQGAKAIYNHAYNPSQAPSTSTLTELEYINDQNTTNYKKSKMEAYAQLWDLLAVDVTGEFLNKFQKCFKQFVQPERTFIYVTDLDEEEDEENDG